MTSLRELLLWLNDWPGGVKLNFELASLFCDAFLWGTGLWEECEIACHSRIAFSSSRNFLPDIFIPVLPYLPSLVYVLGLSGLLGTTMFLSLAADLLSLLTLHIYIFYLMATFVFSWHLSMLGALFNIFRGECFSVMPLSCLPLTRKLMKNSYGAGKKFNLLRNRVEPAVYDVDQLLLGTILFTLAAFLFPTVLVYYLAFASVSREFHVLFAARPDFAVKLLLQ